MLTLIGEDSFIKALPQGIVSRLSGMRSGTLLTLTPEEITASGDLGLIASYRQSRLTQLMKANTKLPADQLFIDNIKTIFNNFRGSENAYQDFVSQTIQQASGRSVSEMELALRAAGLVIKQPNANSFNQEAALRATSAFESFYQRTQISALSDKSELGTYVNRLGWAVSSEEQRVAAIRGFSNFAESTDNVGLQNFAKTLAARTSFVFNPESAIDVAVGAKVLQTMGATYADLYQAFIVASGDAFSEQVIQESLGKTLFSLTGGENQNFVNLIDEYKSLPGAVDVSSMNKQQIFDFFISGKGGSEFSRRALELVDISAKNVGEQLIAATGRELGTLSVLQSLFPEAFAETGTIGIDKVATRLKLSNIIDDSTGDVPALINSIVEGINETFSNLGLSDEVRDQTLNQSPILRKIISLNSDLRSEEKITTKTAAQYKEQLIKFFGYQDEAKTLYAVPDVDEMIIPARDVIAKAKEQLRSRKYNRYAGAGNKLMSKYDTTELSNLMKKLENNIYSGFMESDVLGLSAEDLEAQNRLYQVLKRDGVTKYELRQVLEGKSGNSLLDTLSRQQILDDDMASIIFDDAATKGDIDKVTQKVIGALETNRAVAKIQVRRAVQNMFDQNILAREAGVSGTPDAVDLMHRMLIDMTEMKNATQSVTRNQRQRTTAMIGSMLEEVLFDPENPIVIKSGATTPAFNLQQLSEYVHNTIEEGFTRSVANRTEAVIDLVKKLGEGDIIPSGQNILSKQNIGRALKVDRASALDAETGILRSIPKLQNIEAVSEAIAGSPVGASIDIEFIEDLVAMSTEDSSQVETLIRQRIEAARPAVASESMEETTARLNAIEREVQERVRELKLTAQRGSVVTYLESDEYKAFTSLLVGDEAMGTTGLTGSRTSTGALTIEELVNQNLDSLRIPDFPAEEFLDEIIQSYTDAPKPAPAKFTRIQDLIKGPQAQKAMQALMKNKGKVSAVAALATGLAIFASKKNKEHTEDSITGPPLLPGGNPYERIPRSPMSLEDPTFANPTVGNSYNVSLNADREKTEEFIARAGLLNNGQVSGTMHNSIPTLGRDPYADIAGSF